MSEMIGWGLRGPSQGQTIPQKHTLRLPFILVGGKAIAVPIIAVYPGYLGDMSVLVWQNTKAMTPTLCPHGLMGTSKALLTPSCTAFGR
jgi:hypothetical protein